MGIPGLFSLVRKKGYNPDVSRASTLSNTTNNKGRRLFDVLGTCFVDIRSAYTSQPQDVANTILREKIEPYGHKGNMTLFIDGPQAVEKSLTAQTREAKRSKAMEELSKSLDVYESRLDGGLRLRKQHFVAIRTGFSSSFYWSQESRQNFAKYMQELGWTVVICDTEADVRIAREAQINDIVISKDSDMMGYASVKNLWRPVSDNCIPVYKITDVLLTLGISGTQLTALAVVSRNDYQRNIYSLGPAINFSVIKEIGSRQGNHPLKMDGDIF
jgi:hypothetical protein